MMAVEHVPDKQHTHPTPANACITCVVKRAALYHVTVNAIVMLFSSHIRPKAFATPSPYAGSALAKWATIFFCRSLGTLPKLPATFLHSRA